MAKKLTLQNEGIMEFEKILRLLEDHNNTQEGELRHLQHSTDFYERRFALLQKVQNHMRDPERTIVCDILANGTLLPDPNGERYGFDPKGLK
jgi:hypothetical protein